MEQADTWGLAGWSLLTLKQIEGSQLSQRGKIEPNKMDCDGGCVHLYTTSLEY